jgi:methionyl-tRNA formyltransferase
MAGVIETSNPNDLPAGTLDENLNVICGQDALKILRIKPDGSRLMEFKDFVNGRATRPGDAFIKIDH